MREFKQYLLSLVILTGLVSSIILYRFADGYPLPVGPQFDPHVRQKYVVLLDEARPEVLVFGDSVVETNVDPGQMTQRLGRGVTAISEGGAGSALLHLVLKNNLVRAESRPRLLVLIFRDTVLTSPGFRVQGRFFDVLDEYGGAEDDLTLQWAIRDQMSPLQRTAEAYFPPFWGRWDLRALVVSRFINLPVRLLTGCTQACSEEAMDEVFGNQNFEGDQLNETINSAENYLYTPEKLDFERQLDRSFLPAIIRLCQENNIRLVLVRTKTLRFSVARPEPAELKQYIEDLKTYAHQQHVPVIDFAHEERLDPEHFTDVLHLNATGREIYTEMLSEAIQPFLP